MSKEKRITVVKKKPKCSFRRPDAEKIEGVPYMERWVIYCDCGCTIFGNTLGDTERAWYEHIEGRL